jgi:hypothetical protein
LPQEFYIPHVAVFFELFVGDEKKGLTSGSGGRQLSDTGFSPATDRGISHVGGGKTVILRRER